MAVKRWDGTQWVLQAGNSNKITYQGTSPSIPSAGDVWVDSSTDITTFDGSVQSGNRNKIINGSMDIWQRSTSSTTNGAYNSADRWWVYSNAGTTTWSRESSIVPTSFQYALKAVQSVATASTVIYQVIETANAVSLAGKTVTLSVYFASSAAITINPDVSYTTSVDTAVGGTWTNITATPASWSIPSGSTYARYTATLTIPSTAKSIRVGFGPASITAGTSYYVTGVQLEAGTSATPFEYRPIGQELALCQRYYYRLFPDTSVNTKTVGFGWCTGTTSAFVQIKYPVPMRANPSSIETTATAANYGVFNTIGSGVSSSALPTHNVNTTNETAAINITVASGLTSGSGTALYFATSSNAYLGWNAEL
jgi:hypothetical protein